MPNEEIKREISLEVLIDLCKEYTDSDYVYKSSVVASGKRYIVIMQKVIGAINNEKRDVVDKQCAMYRANMMKIVKIIDLQSGLDVYNIMATFKYYPSNNDDNNDNNDNKNNDVITCYKKGFVVFSDYYDQDTNVIHSNGIHYFRSLAPAYYFNLNTVNYTGPYTKYSDNGDVNEYGMYVQGKKEGIWINIISNNSPAMHEQIEYASNKKHGIYIKWKNSQKQTTGHYFNNLKYGTWIEFYENRSKMREMNYDSYGRLTGLYTFWRMNNHKFISGNYVEGKKDGLWTYDYQDESIIEEERYNLSILHGKYIKVIFGQNERFSSGNYINGKKSGYWTELFDDRKEEGVYEDNERIGSWKTTYFKSDK